MGNTQLAQDEEIPMSLPSLTALPSQNPNPAEIHINHNIITSQITPKTPSEIIAEFINIPIFPLHKISFCAKDKAPTKTTNRLENQPQNVHPQSYNLSTMKHNEKNIENNMTTAKTECSENEYQETNNNQGQIDMLDNLNDSTISEEPIKTEAGSLQIDIRKI